MRDCQFRGIAQCWVASHPVARFTFPREWARANRRSDYRLSCASRLICVCPPNTAITSLAAMCLSPAG